jgi:NAD(P)-dependent dehydrogenase (short-subunit alcohol dehydrogenase family)
MAKEGAKIAIPDVNADAAKQTVDMIKRDGGEAMGLRVDVTKKPEVQGMVNDVLKAYGQIHILVNNAGIDIKGAVTELEESTWDKIMDLNLKAVFLCTQAVLPSMIEQRYGRIVSISSMAGKTGEPFTSPYCASKFGVIGFTQAVALEAGKYKISVNAVCPGPVETELIKESVSQAAKLKDMDPEEFFQSFYIDPTPLGRIARPLDVARAVIFLVSEDAEFITGTTLNVSGGREMH